MTISADKQLTSATNCFSLRKVMRRGDDEAVRRILTITGVFSDEEIEVGSCMASEALEKGAQTSGMDFLFFDDESSIPRAYCCIGPVPITRHSWDFFWLAVDPDYRGLGLAKRLEMEACEHAALRGGHYLFAETSTQPTYEPARRFYQKNGFEELARIPDFYKPGDDKIIYRKVIFL